MGPAWVCMDLLGCHCRLNDIIQRHKVAILHNNYMCPKTKRGITERYFIVGRVKSTSDPRRVGCLINVHIEC